MTAVPRGLPSGTVTFLFTDIEGSTKLLHEPGPEAYAKAVAEHRRKVREAFALIANSNLAWVTGDLGDRDQEVRLEEDNLRLARELGNERMEAGTLATLGVLYAGILDYPTTVVRDDGRLAEAAAMLHQAIRIEHRRGNLLELAVDLGRLASVLTLSGRAGVAASLLASSEALTEQVGASVAFGYRERGEKTLASIHSQLADAAFAEAWEKGLGLTADEAVALALQSEA